MLILAIAISTTAVPWVGAQTTSITNLSLQLGLVIAVAVAAAFALIIYTRRGNENTVFNSQRWLYLKLYRQEIAGEAWKTKLDWYHSVLRNIVKPWVYQYNEIGFIFFSVYGPENYSVETQEYERRVDSPPPSMVRYVRLRAYVTGNKENVKQAFVASVRSHADIVQDYEILRGYSVLNDLGNRYGRANDSSIDNRRTMMFIRYWDAACRYILEILTAPGNWDENVDVWGIPHLVNNSLGGWLRVADKRCSRCSSRMYMCTWTEIPPQLRPQLDGMTYVPICLLVCPQCSNGLLEPNNI
ncbi:MAG TPA: hypothetical protein VJZ75_04505 [Candidatus Bathyarchaeia archaeon]|nr:hypothetical protein [Candidatus Bathyarchaeia archaeon]